MKGRTKEFPKPSCSLKVILSRKGSKAIIFRRGPSNWVRLILWDTKADTFELGQWFHGHIYANRSDLSPDGSLLIYFANKFNQKTIKDKEYTYAWTAISKPPYLTALALWPKGNCWHGGGLFRSGKEVFLNHRPSVSKPHPDHKPSPRLSIVPNPSASGEDGPIWSARMARDGWSLVKPGKLDWHPKTFVASKEPDLIEKRSQDGKQRLQVELFHEGMKEVWWAFLAEGSKRREIAVGTWADFDQRGRLVYAMEGRLMACELENGDIKHHEIADFSKQKPEAIKAPSEATRW